ncbi:MAG: CPBP family intramembrane glutamic endopeptidase [Sphingomonas sp.]
MGRVVELGSRRFLHPGPWIAARALGWMLLLAALVVGAFALVANAIARGWAATHAIDPAHLELLPVPIKLAALIVGPLAAVAVYVLAVRWAEARAPSEFALARMVPELLTGLAIGAAVMGATGLILWQGGWVTLTPQPVTKIFGAIGNSFESGVVEETVFRLVLLRLVWRALGAWPALAASALLFGAAHLANPNSTPFAAVCIAAEAGIMLAAFYILTGRLWVSIGLHAGWNFTQGWALGAPVSGGGGFGGGPLAMKTVAGAPDYLSGGAFGPEASLAALVLCTVVGVAVLWRAAALGRLDGGIASEVAQGEIREETA